MKIVRARDTEECPNCGEDLSPVRGGRAPTPDADWWCPSCMRAFDKSEINDPMNKEPHKGAIARCSMDTLGLILVDEKQEVQYPDGSTAMAWTGVHLNNHPDKFDGIEVGDDWSSRDPEVIATFAESGVDITLFREYSIEDYSEEEPDRITEKVEENIWSLF